MEFAEFVQSRSRDLLRTAWLLTGDWSRAEDVVQAALMQCWPRWKTVITPDAYVRAAIVRTFLSSQRRRWVREIPVAAVPDVAAEDALGPVDVRTAVQAALDLLTPRERTVVILRYFVDLSEADTAEQLGLTRGAVKRYAHDGLVKLRVAPSLSTLITATEEVSG